MWEGPATKNLATRRQHGKGLQSSTLCRVGNAWWGVLHGKRYSDITWSSQQLFLMNQIIFATEATCKVCNSFFFIRNAYHARTALLRFVSSRLIWFCCDVLCFVVFACIPTVALRIVVFCFVLLRCVVFSCVLFCCVWFCSVFSLRSVFACYVMLIVWKSQGRKTNSSECVIF